MNIRNLQNFKESFFDWSEFNDCFGNSGIRISDVDGLIERNGKFLFIETKHPGTVIPTGQQRLHDELIKNGSFDVLLLFGVGNKIETYKIRYHNGAEKCEHVTDNKPVHDIIAGWYKWADKN